MDRKHQSFSGATTIDSDGTSRYVSATVAAFLHSRLSDRAQRIRHKDQCAERLAAGAASSDACYSDQAVLANLDWGIDALEEAISSSNPEAKLARLEHAERMLQIAAMLDPGGSTAGVPNSYLSAWAHLNLALLQRLRSSGSLRAAALHALEMFDVDPFFSRIDFASELWESLFLPHMASIVGWYTEARQQIVMDTIPDSSDLSLSIDFADQLFNESVILSVRPDQAEKLSELERRYGDSLNDSTRMYAKYFKEVLASDQGATGRKAPVPVLPPIAEPPMTPLREVSRSIPDFVKFGPILPKSAGFSPVLSHYARLNTNETSLPAQEEPKQIGKEVLLEENVEIDFDGFDIDMDSETASLNLIDMNTMKSKVSKKHVPKLPSLGKDHYGHHEGHSLLGSPRTYHKVFSSKQNRGYEQSLLLLSNRQSSPSPKTFSPVDSSGNASPDLSPKSVRKYEAPLDLSSNNLKSVLTSPGNIDVADIDDTLEEHRRQRNSFRGMQNFSFTSTKNHALNTNLHSESDDDTSHSNFSVASSGRLTPRTRPPKDFVCPITGQLFNDPVTLETGQTFERRAIEEWLKRGNKSCPITRQFLCSTVLPKTNYVLKRLITSWIEQNPDSPDFPCAYTPNGSPGPISFREFSSDSSILGSLDSPISRTGTNKVRNERRQRFNKRGDSASPISVISQATTESYINELKPCTSCLCTSDNLPECEAAVLTVAKIWKESKEDPVICSFLCNPKVVNGFVEVLSASGSREVLRTCSYVLSELVSANEGLGETLIRVDSAFDCFAALLVSGLAEVAILIYQLQPTFSQLSNYSLVPSLVQVIISDTEQIDDIQFVLEPKDAAIALLDQILIGGDENSRSLNAFSVISANGLPALINSLDRIESRLSIVSVLLSCMRVDKRCRNMIAQRSELAPVLELFHTGNDDTRSICIDFLVEIICLSRRTMCNKILQIIKDEGAFSTMHSFLIYLQMAPLDQQPLVASLLLQLDLLVEPRKMSIYREEAIDSLIEALKRKEFAICQTIALETLCSLSGRLSSLGKPLTEAWLLKTAGFDQPYKTLMLEDQITMLEDEPLETLEVEEKAMTAWEKRLAFVLCNHDNGAIFKALEECLRSNSVEMAKSCLIIATWLTFMLTKIPDTGMGTIASQCLLDQFINVLQSSKNLEEKILAALALNSFIHDPGLGSYVKRIYKPLKRLKRCSIVVTDTLKAIKNLPSIDTTQFWSCTDLFEMESSSNGEVLSLIHSRDWLFSSHSDGTIKVWDAGSNTLKLIQEVHGHSKAVTCLYVTTSGDKLYSGSLDKTIRVWAIEHEEIHSVQVHDVKEAVHCFTSNGDLVCFASQGAGIKVYNWKGASKPINFTRNVKCLAMTEDYIYCGCTGYNIQEVDLSNCSSMAFFSGPKKLLGKQSIHALCTEDGDLFVAGSSADGMAGKVFSFLTKFVQIFKLTTCLCFMEVNMCSLEQSAGSLKSGQESASQELPQSN
ncbi:Zinc finger RING/FYVE/PHD-type protein [Dioscorea alata]|uniref:Zinc finger RING/FYVE/PHD-type protein n=1 Tax=Dioscorea alata TaxID=55571 RepID=A0ACB7TZ17_DIOAL|nr:Zinc finger RING/FYVE/PHD-type protein [Dioscorea alata]